MTDFHANKTYNFEIPMKTGFFEQELVQEEPF